MVSKWNVKICACSIVNKPEELMLRSKELSPDIIIVTESWLRHTNSSKLFSLNGYNLYRADRNLEGGGIAVWSTVEFAEVFVESPNGLRSDILILRIKQYKLLLICLYHPYWGKCKAHETLLQFLNEIIDAQLKNNEVLLISGDV